MRISQFPARALKAMHFRKVTVIIDSVQRLLLRINGSTPYQFPTPTL
jgi:hypothetical protein